MNDFLQDYIVYIYIKTIRWPYLPSSYRTPSNCTYCTIVLVQFRFYPLLGIKIPYYRSPINVPSPILYDLHCSSMLFREWSMHNSYRDEWRYSKELVGHIRDSEGQ
jgi:hypothetical protein